MEGNGHSWFSHLRDYIPFVLAVGQVQTKVSTAKVIEAAVTGICVAAVIGAGGYLVAIPQIEESIKNQAEKTRIQLDFMQAQIADIRRTYERGQELDSAERGKMEERLTRQLERSTGDRFRGSQGQELKREIDALSKKLGEDQR